MAPGRAPSGGSICTGASHGPVCLPVALSFHLDAQFLKHASEQPVPALGSGSFFLLLPLALLLAEAACGSSLSSNDRLFLFGNRKDTVAATFFYPFSKHEA